MRQGCEACEPIARSQVGTAVTIGVGRSTRHNRHHRLFAGFSDIPWHMRWPDSANRIPQGVHNGRGAPALDPRGRRPPGIRRLRVREGGAVTNRRPQQPQSGSHPASPGDPDWTDVDIARCLKCKPAYVRATAMNKGLTLAKGPLGRMRGHSPPCSVPRPDPRRPRGGGQAQGGADPAMGGGMIDFKKRRKALRQAATNRPELRWEGEA